MESNSKTSAARARLHQGLPRQGPGSDENTAALIERLPISSAATQIYDLGCGPGRASLLLARKLQQRIVCIDLHAPFIEELKDSAASANLDHLIDARRGDMSTLDADDESIDLIWCEGAIFCIGFDNGLSLWRPKLSKGGLVVCSELSWLVSDPSTEAVHFWKQKYPPMRSAAANLEAGEKLGYRCIEQFTLPESCWWDEYYGPWSQHLEQLKKENDIDDVLRSMIEDAEKEIDLFRRFSREYGYQMFVFQNE